MSAKEKGSFLEDSVANYFLHLGFNVQRRMKLRDRSDVSHEIDVLASKAEDFGTITVAVECKYVKAPVDIREIRNFHDKLMALGITKGIFISTAGLTVDAASHAKSLGIEFWDLKTLQGKIEETSVPQEGIIRDALPIDPSSLNCALPNHLSNGHLFSITHNLEFKPFIFLDYNCFLQHTVAGNAVILESKGKIVIDAVSGEIADIFVTSGIEPAFLTPKSFKESLSIKTTDLQTNNLPSAIKVQVILHKIDLYQAKNLAKVEMVKNLTMKHSYWTGTGRYLRRHTKIVKPRTKDIEITDPRFVKIPFLYTTFKARDKTYTRIMNAATMETIKDDIASCSFCNKSPTLVCEKCGNLACDFHQKKCLECSRILCDNCIVSKGVFRRKYYCEDHNPT